MASLAWGMMIAVPLAFSAVGAEEVAPAPPPTAAPLSLTEIIALETERYRRLTVPVTIMGQGPYRFMIDTGAQATVLSRDLADRLELFDRNPATLIAMASTRQVETISVERVRLGTREFNIQVAPLLEAANIGGADGILGLDSLQNQRVMFDFENNTLAVADAETLGGNRGFDIVVRARRQLGQLVIHRAKIDGVSVAVIIDTGAQGSVGNPVLQRRLRRARAQADTTMTDVNGVELTGQTRIAQRLEIGRVEIGNFPIVFADSPTFINLGLGDEPAMVLGMSELRMFRRVAIDFTSQQVLFDLPSTAGKLERFNFTNQSTRLD
jgi:predicted aspartyl protease